MNSDSERKAFAERVKKAREKLQLTQSQVAKKAGMTVNYYAMIERGEVNLTLDKITNIGKVLKFKIKYTQS